MTSEVLCHSIPFQLPPASTGTAVVLGRKPWQNPEFLASVAYLPQEAPLYNRLTAEERLEFAWRLNPRWDCQTVGLKLSKAAWPPTAPTDSPRTKLPAASGPSKAIEAHLHRARRRPARAGAPANHHHRRMRRFMSAIVTWSRSKAPGNRPSPPKPSSGGARASAIAAGGSSRQPRIAALLGAVAVTVSLGACGSSASSTGLNGSDNPAPTAHTKWVTFAGCMRSHGLPTFPDPKSHGSGLHLNTTGGTVIVDGEHLDPTAFQTALRACRSLLPAGRVRSPVNATRKQAAIRHAQCMRAHGVPNFPDPTFANGHIEINAPGVDPNSPAYKAAVTVCGAYLTGN